MVLLEERQMKSSYFVPFMICIFMTTGCVSIKKTYEYDPAPQVWQVNGKAVAVLLPQEQEAWKGIVK